MFLRKLVILGPGLLGASLLKAASRFGLAERTAAWARRAELRQACRADGLSNEVHHDVREVVQNADMIVVCTPVDTIADLVGDIAPVLAPDCVVTDVGSTKSLICRQSHAKMQQGHFIGSHPMAGSEKSGMEHSTATLFEGRACLVTPLPESHPEAVERVVELWRRVGMQVTTLSPERHDETVANISHLPHLLASSLCSYLAGQDDRWRNFSGNGLRDTTRIASGSPALWRSICRHNREEILRALDGFDTEMARLRSALNNSDFLEVENILARGKLYRDRLPPLNGSPGCASEDNSVSIGS